MIEVEQTILAPPDGDCFAACVASIFEMPLADVPSYTGDDWFYRWVDWFWPKNLTPLNVSADPSGEWTPAGYSILAADSPRYPGKLHAVVAYNGRIVWDPHPGRSAGVGAWKEWTVFTVIDPSRPVPVR